jgi:hypothetical protein
MNHTPMRNKFLVASMVLLLLGGGTIPVLAQPFAMEPEPVADFWEHFGLISTIVVSWDANMTEEPIIPRGEIRGVPLECSFSVMYGVLGRLIHLLMRNHLVIMTVSVVEVPEWCTAVISQGNLSVLMPPDEGTIMTATTWLSVMVSDQAPAFELCPVKIQVTVEPRHGPFGFIPLLQGFTQEILIAFIVGYKPLIQPSYPQGNVIETPPLVQVKLPIGITNLGNGKTIVENEVVNHPDGWVVTLPEQLILEVGERKEMNLSFVAPAGFSGEASITVSFTPHSFDNYSLVGQTGYGSFIAYYRPP